MLMLREHPPRAGEFDLERRERLRPRDRCRLQRVELVEERRYSPQSSLMNVNERRWIGDGPSRRTAS